MRIPAFAYVWAVVAGVPLGGCPPVDGTLVYYRLGILTLDVLFALHIFTLIFFLSFPICPPYVHHLDIFES